MKNLYLKVEITSKTRKAQVEYYTIKEENYGIEIVQKEDEKQENQIIFHNISNNENVVESIIDMISGENEDFEQMKYIVEDCIKK